MKFRIAVSDFALPAPRRGSIETYSGFAQGATTGIEIHRQLQLARASANDNYSSEVSIESRFQSDGFEFEVSGRIDGLYKATAEARPHIEEIKSSFNMFELLRRLKTSQDEHPYCLQLLTYGYFYWLQEKTIPRLTLHLVSSRNLESTDFELHLDIPKYEAWLGRRLAELVIEANTTKIRDGRRRKAALHLKFPFQNPRSGQLELIADIEAGMKKARPMMIQAPTGLGKTMGVLFPVLKEALSRGQQVIYATPKNSQHSVAEDAIQRLQNLDEKGEKKRGAKVKAMTLTAKSKMCLKNEPICNPEYCEFAKDHFTKVAELKIVEQLAGKRNLTARVFKKIAQENEVCPFHLQLSAVAQADLVICDYNYVFSPHSILKRQEGLAVKGHELADRANLVIDEAHNLPGRAMGYYSPSLSTVTLERMIEELGREPLRVATKFRAEFKILVRECIDVIGASGKQKVATTGTNVVNSSSQPRKIEPPVAKFLAQDEKVRGFLSKYLKAEIEIQPRDLALRLSFYWSEFAAVLDFVDGNRREFFTTFHPDPAVIRITCCDASPMLKDTFKVFSQVVAFSATLKPFSFYQELMGLAEANPICSEYRSPFSKCNRKLLIIPQISSKYAQRERNYAKVAEAVQKIAQLKRGNYFIFFPSFIFLERVFALFQAPDGFAVLKQNRNLGRAEINAVFDQLRARNQAHIVFAVQGGVFSEGVDYPGEMIIGAFIVGPPLANFDLERETMRSYYQERYQAGFDYAYTYPAMAKAVQSAGRVIRSETDRGIIVLMDDRFIQPSFVKSMPRDWFQSTAQELVSQQILTDVAQFWSNNSEMKI